MARIHNEEEAKNFYKHVGSVPCPEFEGERVAFNSIGFRHLILKRGVRRSKKEQMRRFALLPDAIFWTLTQDIDSQKIIVIIRQFQGGKKHFLSVYSEKIKKLPQ